jgi:hypothetical protein
MEHSEYSVNAVVIAYKQREQHHDLYVMIQAAFDEFQKWITNISRNVSAPRKDVSYAEKGLALGNQDRYQALSSVSMTRIFLDISIV